MFFESKVVEEKDEWEKQLMFPTMELEAYIMMFYLSKEVLGMIK
jgi:hypothetical protein